MVIDQRVNEWSRQFLLSSLLYLRFHLSISLETKNNSANGISINYHRENIKWPHRLSFSLIVWSRLNAPIFFHAVLKVAMFLKKALPCQFKAISKQWKYKHLGDKHPLIFFWSFPSSVLKDIKLSPSQGTQTKRPVSNSIFWSYVEDRCNFISLAVIISDISRLEFHIFLTHFHVMHFAIRISNAYFGCYSHNVSAALSLVTSSGIFVHGNHLGISNRSLYSFNYTRSAFHP